MLKMPEHQHFGRTEAEAFEAFESQPAQSLCGGTFQVRSSRDIQDAVHRTSGRILRFTRRAGQQEAESEQEVKPSVHARWKETTSAQRRVWAKSHGLYENLKTGDVKIGRAHV